MDELTHEELHEVLTNISVEEEGTKDGIMAGYIAAYEWHENFEKAARDFLAKRAKK
jgi:hypothetical protein